MQYTEEQLRHLTAEYLRSEAHRRMAHELEHVWSHEAHGPRRYVKVFEDDSLTLWLLGWRPGVDTVDHHVDVTPIHGHGASAALITCLQGEVDQVDFGIVPVPLDEMPREAAPREVFTSDYRVSTCSAGHSIYVPVGGVHDMRCDEKDGRGFSLTLHAYSPRLSVMTYFRPVTHFADPELSRRLLYVDRWVDKSENLTA